MYNGHPNRISTAQLEEQVNTIEELKARKMAAASVGVDWNHEELIYAEMRMRVHVALIMVDSIDCDYEDWVAETQELRHG